MPPPPPSLHLRGPRQLLDVPLPAFSYLEGFPLSACVNIRHPAYDARDDLLFSFYAWDDAIHGIYYGLVHDACAIIADNRHDGWLATSPLPTAESILCADDAILPAGDYWYHVPGAVQDANAADSETPFRWPVVACFRDWQFPNTLPATWRRMADIAPPQGADTGAQSTSASLVRTRDLFCRITKHSTATEVAHICPEQEQEWFMANAMHRYNNNKVLDAQNLLNDTGNMLLLRSDLHKAFDLRIFVFYPKDDAFVVHMLQPTKDIGLLYHNTRTHSISDCKPEFLYARFAWAIFPFLAGFLNNPTTARSIVSTKTTDGRKTRVVEELGAEVLRARTSLSRSRSPRKRSRPEQQGAQTEESSGPGTGTMEQGPGKESIKEDELARPAAKRQRRTSTYNHHSQQNADAQESPIPSLQDDSVTSGDREEADYSPNLAKSQDITLLREQYLSRQRPADFVPIQGSIFADTCDPKVILERAGLEIRDDSSDGGSAVT